MNLFHPRFAPRQNSSNSRQRSTWLALAIATSCQLYASSVVRSGDPTFTLTDRPTVDGNRSGAGIRERKMSTLVRPVGWEITECE